MIKSFFIFLFFSFHYIAFASVSDDTISQIIQQNKLNAEQSKKLNKLLKKTYITQGNAKSYHPISKETCQQEVLLQNKLVGGLKDEEICGFSWMSPIYDKNNKLISCIDRFEFPNIPCDYPITWVQANEAQEICESVGKRLCDAHEWESACANKYSPPDYHQSRSFHNAQREILWSYGNERNPSLCAMGIPKSPGCDQAISTNVGVAQACGTNTFPSGYKYQCSGNNGVYDIHGNAAEHMNLPTSNTNIGKSGLTEMKGSWFVFSNNSNKTVHEDDCLWRAPGWHRTNTNDPRSHANYHLGFRCCSYPK